MKRRRIIIAILSLFYWIFVLAISYRYSDIEKNNALKPETFSKEVQVFCWDKSKEDFRKAAYILPDDISSSSDNRTNYQQADLNGNSISEEYSLEDGIITISESSKIIWQSEKNWQVAGFILADSNNDGVVDINLSVWKAGNFGDFMPLWVEENDMSIKNHFFIFDLQGEKIKSIWQSSNLAVPNCQFLINDVNADGDNELTVLEGDYADIDACNSKYFAVWKWHEWGFKNEWRSERGNFDKLKIDNFSSGVCITVLRK